LIVDVHPEVTQVWSEPLTQRKTEDWLQIFRNADLAAVQMITHEDHPTEGRTAVLHVRSVPTAIGYRCEAHLPPAAGICFPCWNSLDTPKRRSRL
jgi:hypothetical protein